MSGRFFSAPLVATIAHVARVRVPRFSWGWAATLASIWLIGLSAPRSPLLSSADYGRDLPPLASVPVSHITDERRYYYPYAGLLTVRRGASMPDHRWWHLGEAARRDGASVALTDAAGYIGYAAGPAVHYIDKWGLGDPLMARLPASPPWNVGHYPRDVPEGYVDTVRSGENRIRDPGVAAYYEKLRLITEGPIWRRERFDAIVQMNLGRYEGLIASYGVIDVPIEQLAEPRENGTPWTFESNVQIRRAARVRLPRPATGGEIEVSLSRNDLYRLQFIRNGVVAGRVRVERQMTEDSSLVTHRITVPAGAVFDSIWIEPLDGDNRYALGHLLLRP
jgi:arabinofuranosyltransferase